MSGSTRSDVHLQALVFESLLLVFLRVVVGQRLADLPLILIDALRHGESLLDVEILKLTVSVTDDTLCLAFAQKIDCHAAHDGRIDTVLRCRGTAALHVAEDCRTCLDACCGLNSSRHGCGMADTLCVDDDVMLLASAAAVDDVVDQLLLIVVVLLRKKDILRAVCDAAPQSEVAGAAAHNLDDRASLMRCRCIADLIDRFHRCVNSRIKSDYPGTDLARKASAESALIYYQNGNYDDAIEAYKEVISKYPGSDEARTALVDLKSIYVEKGDVNSYLEYAGSVQGAAPIAANERDSLSYAAAEGLRQGSQRR